MKIAITEYKSTGQMKLEVDGDIIHKGSTLSAVETLQAIAKYRNESFCYIEVKEGD